LFTGQDSLPTALLRSDPALSTEAASSPTVDARLAVEVFPDDDRSSQQRRARVADRFSPSSAAHPSLRSVFKRLFDLVVAGLLLVLMAPVFLVLAVAIKCDSSGPVFFRCRRIGLHGSEFSMLKFRKMHDGAGGPALTSVDDARFTRLGRWLARSKLDELPQLLNVIAGHMSLVGPRPEHPSFARFDPSGFADVLRVRPGMTGLSQLAFAREADVLRLEDRITDYVQRVLPQKVALDRLYVERWSPHLDLKILAWTAVAVLLRGDVAVNRETGRLGRRHRERLAGSGTPKSEKA
jgi:lipopolysaccharide/colanic/teichoic acid biosynthesis glycosyltransferase